MPLTDLACKNAKPKDKPYKLADSQGLYLSIQPNGSKYWRINYRFLGKQKSLALGVYPETSLGKAREQCQAARKQLANPDNGIAAQFDNKVAKRLQSWARDKECSIGLQCTGRENSAYKEPSRKFISAAERRARERAAYNPNLQPMIDQLSAELRQEWRELANKERQEISAVYEQMRRVREAGRVQRKIIKSQTSKKIKHLYKRSQNPFFFTTAWLEKNEWKRLGKRTYARFSWVHF